MTQNFLICILDAQFGGWLVNRNGTLSDMGKTDWSINMLFTCAFTLELLFNLFGNWFKRFMRSGWNWFDVLTVGISLIDYGVPNIPDWLVKLMRAFRVIRLFGRVRALETMVTAVTASIVPMMHAFVILVIVLCICEATHPHTAPARSPLVRATRARVTLTLPHRGPPAKLVSR